MDKSKSFTKEELLVHKIETFKHVLGYILKIARDANNLSRSKAAELSGVSVPYIYEVEAGKKFNVSVEVLEKLANAYSLTINQLFSIASYYSTYQYHADVPLPFDERAMNTKYQVIRYIRKNYNLNI